MIDTEIKISNGGSHTTCWIILIGKVRYDVRTTSTMGSNWTVEKYNPESCYFDSLIEFRCNDNLKAMNKGLGIAIADYELTH